MFALPISMPRFKSVTFYQNIPKVIFAKKSKFFCVPGAPPPDPRASAAGGFAPRPPASGSWRLGSQAPIASPYCEFLTTRRGGCVDVILCKLILRLAIFFLVFGCLWFPAKGSFVE